MVDAEIRQDRFRDKVVVVTGAAGGIGAATARRFAAEGATLVLVDLPAAAEKRDAVMRACTTDGAVGVLGLDCDVSRDDDVAAAMKAAMARFGHVDVVVNVAGYMAFKPIQDFSGDEWRRLMDVNFMGAVYFTQEALRMMRPGGAIVNVSSIHAFQTTARVAPYAAAKAALTSLTRSTAIEGKALGIRANAVAPGAIDTPMFWTSPNIASGEEKVPDNMLGQPENIAAVVAFLASSDAAFMTGSTVTADGGRLSAL
ncbi:MAG: SDR family oxidoreductase [Alphaproteobacteria bacterium]|nr:SDR family oxidoreductase [Alphaproteobacteria bacterium]